MVATESGEVQLAANLAARPYPGLRFERGSAQAAGQPIACFDVVVMFKSLHHVPVEAMDDALAKIRRVLRPGGDLYVSEPVFAGEFNEIMRLFHDEEFVRTGALAALRARWLAGCSNKSARCISSHRSSFRDIIDFEVHMMHVTHSQVDLDPERIERVRRRFMQSAAVGGVRFERPMRVNRLSRVCRS